MVIILILFFLSTAFQSISYLVMGISWKKVLPIEISSIKQEPISIIVAARNEAHKLPVLIESLISQQYKVFEIIIVLDRCTDNSFTILDAYQQKGVIKVIEIKELKDGYSGKKLALTEGIKSASHDLLVFTDADCKPYSENWLSQINQSIDEDTQIAIGFGPYLKKTGILNLFIRYETILTAIQYFSFANLKFPYMGVGRNMAYRKSFFLKNKGFAQFKGVIGGDDDLFISHNATSSNLKSYYVKDTHVFSEGESSWKALFNQKKRHLSVGKYYPGKHQIILGLLATSQVMFWLTFVIFAILKGSSIILVTCFSTRLFFLSVYFWTGTKKINSNYEFLWIPFMDVVHTLFLLIMGPIGFFTKRIKWN